MRTKWILAAILAAAIGAGYPGRDEFAEKHKYFTDPAKPDAGRGEFTYTITSVMQLAQPYRLADMNDDYQDARLLAEDADTATVEVTYYPLNTNREGIGENPNWKRDYAGMTEYLAPTPTENWDEKMRDDLLSELRRDGIDPDRLTDRQVAAEVSRWLMKRSRYNKAFAIWYVHFPDGNAQVFPLLRTAFDKEKPDASWTDQAMFDEEVLGRSMFYRRVHGSCTSSAVYLATVMRALGIPARIVICVPPADGNDATQKQMLLASIHHHGVRMTIQHGLPRGGFSNHLFNEVFVGNRWVRLNYDVLGQNILDSNYFGLLTHIMTVDSLSHVPLAETWGKRYAMYPKVGPALSSVNPYRLLKVSDHFGAYAKIANPEVENVELRAVTVTQAYWKDALPAPIQKQLATNHGDPTNPDFYIGIAEYIPDYPNQMRDFEGRAGHRFVLSAPGHPDLKATLSGMKLSNGPQYRLWGVKLDAESRGDIAAGVEYEIRPLNTSAVYTWSVRDGVRVKVTEPR
jgi:transglutaminase-like putative cysteine protease